MRFNYTKEDKFKDLVCPTLPCTNSAISNLILHYHGEQKYGKQPYIYHLNNVKDKVLNITFFNEDLTVIDLLSLSYISVLHDILEDTDVSIDEIKKSLRLENLTEQTITDIINSVVILTKYTNNESYNYNTYISNINSNKLAWFTKVADTLCNLEESMIINDSKRIKKYNKQLTLLTKEQYNDYLNKYINV